MHLRPRPRPRSVHERARPEFTRGLSAQVPPPTDPGPKGKQRPAASSSGNTTERRRAALRVGMCGCVGLARAALIGGRACSSHQQHAAAARASSEGDPCPPPQEEPNGRWRRRKTQRRRLYSVLLLFFANGSGSNLTSCPEVPLVWHAEWLHYKAIPLPFGR